MNKTQIAKKLGIRFSTVGVHVKKLESLELVKPINSNGKSKFYKSTSVTPTV